MKSNLPLDMSAYLKGNNEKIFFVPKSKTGFSIGTTASSLEKYMKKYTATLPNYSGDIAITQNKNVSKINDLLKEAEAKRIYK